MMKGLALLLISTCFSCAAANSVPETQTWHAITFGQSTDINFATNVLPDKVGVNQVTLAGGEPLGDAGGRLITPVQIESRGGKIGNSHDGLTFYYTRVPAGANAQLEAEIGIEQFGPENGALPAGQEGAGLLFRDTLGKPRQEKMLPGYEEFPAASNMVMNAVITQDKKSAYQVKTALISRNGVVNAWGNADIEIKRKAGRQNIDLRSTPRFRLRLSRTDSGFEAAWADLKEGKWIVQSTHDAERLTVQEKEGYYVGFFAARNAKITVYSATLTLSDRHSAVPHVFVSKPVPLKIEIASAPVSAGDDYVLQLRSNQNGKLVVKSGSETLSEQKPVIAGEMQRVPVSLPPAPMRLDYVFTSESGEVISDGFTVTRARVAIMAELYASPAGKPDADGSLAKPLDIATAAALLAPGGVLWLADGDYSLTTFPAAVSGTRDRPKRLRPLGHHAVLHGFNLAASYWDIAGIKVTEKSFTIAGSHNRIDKVEAYEADDTGIWVASPPDVGRPLWASHNVISRSESWGNRDPGMINADGFAVKMRVGEGNKLIACFAHHNIDDGFDLFNKIEDGPNGRVIIEKSVAMRNVNNGFKMGGEGLPVAHEISDSVAIENGMDGFTDNFNPGSLAVKNNTAIDNKRFNYIFRPGPYVTPEQQGVFSGNISLRTSAGVWPDAVNGTVKSNNIFITTQSVNP
ncbi:right-handed parallel beta-helix repeat-containing protein [Erwinia oleae]|uniref:right-handed parallel beta-helix repeat-containing protein n=1 Tax=Erwinia oleae TaxID=796334 RepID=UPI000A89A2AA|nr:right-handed parallel beta-helix repeat-containing protein [Erwinia oleae]